MPLSPTGSSRSFKGPADLDRTESERSTSKIGATINNPRSPTSPSAHLATTQHPSVRNASSAGHLPSPLHADREPTTEEELLAITKVRPSPTRKDQMHLHLQTQQHHPTPWELYEKPHSPSPSSPLHHNNLKVTFTSASAEPSIDAHSHSGYFRAPTDGSENSARSPGPSSALHLTSLPQSSSSQVNHFSAHLPSPGSPSSAGSLQGTHGQYQAATSSTTPPSALRSPGSAGGFFSAFRPASPRILENVSDRKREKERAPSTGADKSNGSDGPQLRSLREKGLDSRSRRPSSVFEHVNSVFERFSKRVHSRSDSREGVRHAIAGASSTNLLPSTEEAEVSRANLRLSIETKVADETSVYLAA